jgi:hypothetical protein
MKSYISTVFLCAGMLSVSGCGSANTKVNLSPTHYTVNAMILAVPREVEPLLGSVSQSKLEDVAKRHDTIATRLPTIHILPGETKKAETGKTHSYPIDFDAEGNPTKHNTARDGLTMRATLSLTQDQRPRLAIAVEDSKIAKWITSPAGNKTPLCEIRRSSTTIQPKWGEWHNIATVMATGTNKGQVILVRIDKPNKESFNN